ncbi:TAXI family TRAP transporter solute-binding subunit [Variovorax terrae]|uniref:ABC transporter substrate-binding protein n=1 Tax=Variovorax terrae TaxID=2923278 RepID=A0A9X1VVW9_9BURK|nr:TAXI family TRAP transporter solute-binding subunit [Variovorax terrae]MCJ0763935.1 ABC transporter substrate-binding protein [Variovorax terrae]
MAAARLYQRKWVLIKLPIALLALATMAWLWLEWLPMPPSQLRVSAGRADGVYYAYAQQYAQKFAEHGVTLEVLESDGALQNLQRLHGEQAELAFMQGGVGYLGSAGNIRGSGRVQTLANIDIEPLWIFSRLRDIESLQQLQGLKVSLGPAGSGTRLLALKLLEQVRLGPKDLTVTDTAGMAAVQALQQGTLDAAVMVLAPESAVINALLIAPGLQLVQLRRTAALTERLPYLEPHLLAQGTLDPTGRHPPQDATLLTVVASLVARDDLHPALKRLATQIASEIHARSGLFYRPGEFPSLKRLDFPASAEARHTLVHGLPWLEAHLPFWWAQVTTRLLVICLPVLLLALWLAHLIPAYLRWLVESRVTRWYGELKYIELDLSRDSLSGLDLTKYLGRLNSIERRMAAFVTPAYLMPRWFMLRQHIDFVRLRLYRRRGR